MDIRVKDADIRHVSPIDSLPEGRWDAVIAINPSSNFQAIKALLPQMKACKWGRIDNIASMHGLVASADKMGRLAANRGVVGLTKSVALETARTGITCDDICPGWVLTPLVQQQVDARAKRDAIRSNRRGWSMLAEKQPSGAFETRAQIGAVCSFLCSDAAAQIRGASLPVVGAWLAQ